MAALSAVVFALSWWLGLYLLARDPRKPLLVLAAVGLCSFAVVVALDAVRLAALAQTLGRIEIYLVVVPGVAWFAVLLEMARPGNAGGRARSRQWRQWQRWHGRARRWPAAWTDRCAPVTG